MEPTPGPNFLCLVSDEGTALLNLSLVRMVGEIEDGKVTLHFSEQHRVTIHGNAANELVSVLVLRSVMTNGEPAGPLINEALKSQSPG